MEALDFIKELMQGNINNNGAIAINPKGLPVWLRKAVQIYTIPFAQIENIYLIKPKDGFEFGQLVNIREQIEKRLEGVVLLIADELNPKFRSLFVRNNIPFIYKNISVFAPDLGIILFDNKKSKKLKNRNIEKSINPFELKLLAGYLTGHIVREGFNLGDFETILIRNKYKCSKGKLSQAINHLIDLDYMNVKGSGPNRLVTFKDRQEIWEELKDGHVKLFYKMVEAYYWIDNKNYIYSDEMALAHYSNLAEPKLKHIAVTNKELATIESMGETVGNFGEPEFIFDVFREPPALFAMDDGYLNPIELYFMLKDHTDERIQMELERMLSKYGLKI